VPNHPVSMHSSWSSQDHHCGSVQGKFLDLSDGW
jgi:hypothetical protein